METVPAVAPEAGPGYRRRSGWMEAPGWRLSAGIRYPYGEKADCLGGQLQLAAVPREIWIPLPG